jgi:hypothetical protein
LFLGNFSRQRSNRYETGVFFFVLPVAGLLCFFGSWAAAEFAESYTRKPDDTARIVRDPVPADPGRCDTDSVPIQAGMPDLPDSVFAVARVQDGKHSCSATAVAIVGGDTWYTCARHCFGTKARDGITVKTWDIDAKTGARVAIESKGEYRPGPAPADAATVVIRGYKSRYVSVVATGVSSSLRGRNCVAVGCPGGVWPPQAFRGRVATAGTDTVWSTCRIAGGQSGGGLFDLETGYLIGITNWGRNAEAGCGSLSLELTNKLLDANLPKQ